MLTEFDEILLIVAMLTAVRLLPITSVPNSTVD